MNLRRAFVRVPAKERRLLLWPLIVPGLLLLQVAVSGLTLYAALSNPSFAAEPDYYRKAMDWDATAARKRAEAALGWRLQVDVSSTTSASNERAVRVLVHDRDGKPVEGAAVSAEVFHHARAAERSEVVFSGDGAGCYAATLEMRRIGLWEFRLKVLRGEERVTATRVVDVGAALGVR